MRDIISSLTLLLLWGLIHQNCRCDIVPGEDYIYLSPELILHLPDFKQITCEQNFPGGTLDIATAGLVMSGGAERLVLCGGYSMTTCWMLETGGWVDMQHYFDRVGGASSRMGAAYLVTGGGTQGDTMLSTTQIFSEDQWRDGPEMPQHVHSHCQVEIDGAAYIIGGWDGHNALNSVYKLEHGSAEWAAVSSLDTARRYHSCAVLDSRIYVMGGDGDDTVEVFDPASDTWTYGPVLPTYRSSWYAEAIAYGGTVYVIEDVYNNGDDNNQIHSYTPGPGAEWDTLPGVSVSYRGGRISPAPVVTTDTLYCVASG